MKNIPIVILHGWNLSSARFSPLTTELKKRGYSVYCPDLPGFGKVKLPKTSCFLADYVGFVRKFLAENKLSKFILIGHSFGGRIGIKLAAQNANLLSALILTGTPGINPVPTIKKQFFSILAKLGKLTFSLPILSSAKDLFRKFLYKAANATDYYNTDENLLETFRNIVRESLGPYMSRIDTPTLLLWGEDDQTVPVSIAEKMLRLIKNSKLVVIPDARHDMPWSHPKEFVDKVEDFLIGLRNKPNKTLL